MAELGDRVQPYGLELEYPFAWKIVGFVAAGMNPKYKIVIEHPTSGDRLSLENLPRNTKKAND